MTGLMVAIPGLSVHQAVIPEAVVSFDLGKADRLLRTLNTDVGAAFPGADCMCWLVEHKAEVWNALCKGENDVDVAYLAEDMPALEKHVDLCRRMYLKAFALYATRPPVIEVQESLL